MSGSAELLVLPEAVRAGAAALHVVPHGSEQRQLAIDGRFSEKLQESRLPLAERARQAVVESRALSVQRRERFDEIPDGVRDMQTRAELVAAARSRLAPDEAFR